MKSILISNAVVVNEGELREGDVLVKDGRIERIAADLSAVPADIVLDAAGLHLLPGMIDDQVHFREPGLTHKGDIRSESRAAVAGGITSLMEMPNTKPPATTLEALEIKHALGAEKSLANYSFYLGATNDNLDEIRRLDPDRCCGIKVFMGASTGNMLVDDPGTLRAIFRDAPALIATHCEDTPTIEANEREFRERYGETVPFACHPLIRSAEACYKSSSMAVELAREYGTRLHVLHLTTERELSLFGLAPIGEKRITAEVCVHHLMFDDRDYEEKGALIKCNPAIKRPEDRHALIEALIEGRLDVVGTDHAPHTLEEKSNTYFKAPSGLPLVQHALPALLELYHDGRMGLEDIVYRSSHAVAECFRIRERGYIREGYKADLVLVDLNRPQTVARDDVLYKCGWSPFEGRTLRSSVRGTLVSGRLVYREGRFLDEAPGARLAFNRSDV
ncbi:MAG: dihydroorotase [Gammaproteobacteria bacterium]|jgi:dihydroorotase|nr:dihydroorotase [Gammaproteobacteria bacterium]